MRATLLGMMTAGLMAVGMAGEARACLVCHKTPCVIQYQCVTEMVPYTVMRPVTRCDFVPVTRTVMVSEPQTTYFTQKRLICHPVFETTWQTCKRVVCRPQYDTRIVSQTVPVCRPVTTTRLVTVTCMQP